MSRLLLGLVILTLVSVSGWSQEVPLGNCRQLPIVKTSINKHDFQFLVDTGAAVTLLNKKSFSSLETTEITLESWNGSAGASAREVTLHDLTIGEHSLFNLKLLAVDLTQMERSCQRRVDGVLGADLIAKMGLTIDLKNHVATVEASAHDPEAHFSQVDQHVTSCEEAFNRSDEKAFEQCLSPDMVLITSKGEFRGRKAVMKHIKETYFGQNPPVLVTLTPRGRQAIGTVVWVEYDMEVNVGCQTIKSRSTALYQKSGERWLMSNMDNSVMQDK